MQKLKSYKNKCREKIVMQNLAKSVMLVSYTAWVGAPVPQLSRQSCWTIVNTHVHCYSHFPPIGPSTRPFLSCTGGGSVQVQGGGRAAWVIDIGCIDQWRTSENSCNQRQSAANWRKFDFCLRLLGILFRFFQWKRILRTSAADSDFRMIWREFGSYIEAEPIRNFI